ncbi:hypothetical protein Bbelb_374180 [Branchiostoma belcheri]|nr:hypothetical protein Bbelb_374180 [Branchiostoma belcheri]
MEVTKENQSQKKEGEQVDRQDEDLDAEHGRVNVMLGRGAKFQRAAPTDTSPRHLDMGDHVVEYPEHLEDLCSDDKAYTTDDTNADEEAEADSFHKDGDRAIEMLRMMTSSKVCWVALGCGLLVIASVVTAAILASLLISKGKDDEGKPDVDDIVKVSASPSWWTTFYKDNSSAFPTSTLPHFSSTLFKDVNECVARPCGHGNCVNYPGGYRCTCLPGWTGQNCQQVVNMQKWAKMYAAMPEDINECTTNPCQHGRCENYAGEYSCTCFTGWTGKNCQQGYYSVKETSMSVSETHVSMEAVLTKMADTIATVTMDGLEQTVSKNTVMPFSTAIPCQGGWSEYNNHCYKLFKDKVSWSTANERCKQHGANLASVGSAGENNFIARLITDGG